MAGSATCRSYWSHASEAKFLQLARFVFIDFEELTEGATKFGFHAGLEQLRVLRIDMVKLDPGDKHYDKADASLLLYEYHNRIVKENAIETQPKLLSRVSEILRNAQLLEHFIQGLQFLFWPWYSNCSSLIRATSFRQINNLKNKRHQVDLLRKGCESMLAIVRYYYDISRKVGAPANALDLWEDSLFNVANAAWPLCPEPDCRHLKDFIVEMLCKDSARLGQQNLFQQLLFEDLRPSAAMDVPMPTLLPMEPHLRFHNDANFTEEELSRIMDRAFYRIGHHSTPTALETMLRAHHRDMRLYDSLETYMSQRKPKIFWSRATEATLIAAIIQEELTGVRPKQKTIKGTQLKPFDKKKDNFGDWRDLNLVIFEPSPEAVPKFFTENCIYRSRVPSLVFLSSIAARKKVGSSLSSAVVSESVWETCCLARRVDVLIRLFVYLLLHSVEREVHFDRRTAIEALLPFCDQKKCVEMASERLALIPQEQPSTQDTELDVLNSVYTIFSVLRHAHRESWIALYYEPFINQLLSLRLESLALQISENLQGHFDGTERELLAEKTKRLLDG